MDIQTSLLAGLLLAFTMVWAGCRACDDEPKQTAGDQTHRQAGDPQASDAKTKEKNPSREEPPAKDPALKPTLNKHPKVEIRPGAVVDRSKRPRNVEALKRLAERRETKEASSSKDDRTRLDNHANEDGRPR